MTGVRVSRPSSVGPAARGSTTVTQEYRYRLELRSSLKNNRQICWVLLNPSPKPPDEMNGTRRAVLWFSEREGYGKIVIVNRYAAVTHRAADLYDVPRPEGIGNDEVVRAAFSESSKVIFGWGGFRFNWVLYFPTDVEHIASQLGIAPWCLGRNQDGSPKHPLFADRMAPLQRYQLR